MDFKEFDMVWGGNVGLLLQIYITSNQGHQQYLKQPPYKTYQGYPYLQVGIQVLIEHFGY